MRTGTHNNAEEGFTLPEIMTAIAIMGILLAIAIIILLGILEQRRVDAAANQLAADLRLAHARATNQLTDWRVVLFPERGEEEAGPDYWLVKLREPYDSGEPTPTVVVSFPRTFPANVKVRDHNPALKDPSPPETWMAPPSAAGKTRTLEFNSDGSAWVRYGPNGSVRITIDGDPERRVVFLSATSRIRID
ncbi:Type IV minor pilin PilE [Rubrobacter xylanophilus DSM 9941]|uniref:pilus assembly FimT family protein n=1 Tax=Rubrobacter xylanophilus TaxID=49319 RepID=UPI001C63D6E3|nr:GspH/FimT family pseudopilin [Rubrobacter xylanophilus]QYJ14402.1 Type IV minor pilin PilE [Rubrobacter xylanophilus DSM 9941]